VSTLSPPAHTAEQEIPKKGHTSTAVTGSELPRRRLATYVHHSDRPGYGVYAQLGPSAMNAADRVIRWSTARAMIRGLDGAALGYGFVMEGTSRRLVLKLELNTYRSIQRNNQC
jgi:hypothetical protein